MRRTRYIISGLLLIVVPILLAQVLMKKTEPEIAKKIAPPPLPKKVNPLLQELLVDYDKEIIALTQEANTPGAAIAVVHDSSIVFLKPYGVKKAGSSDP